jgi:hypothetical protein
MMLHGAFLFVLFSAGAIFVLPRKTAEQTCTPLGAALWGMFHLIFDFL